MPGRTGFAHLFEHVMFTGSGHVPYGLHDKLTEGVGGSNNGTTSNDRTTYFETVPSNYLESALWLESDRMGFLLDTLDLAKLNAQRDIVKNERRQGVDNQPYGRVGEILAEATYPASNPYSWDVIGSMDDLSAASEEDVKDFFRLYYAPNNAFLADRGRLRPGAGEGVGGEVLRRHPARQADDAADRRPVTLPAETRLVYEDRVQVPRLYVQWPTVGEKHDDRSHSTCSAAILAGPRTARLTKALVYDQQAAPRRSRLPGPTRTSASSRWWSRRGPGNSLTDLEAAADAIIAKLKAGGPDGRGGPEGAGRRGARLPAGARVEPRQGDELCDGAGFHGDAGLLQDDLPEIAGGHGRRREARGEQVSDRGAASC